MNGILDRSFRSSPSNHSSSLCTESFKMGELTDTESVEMLIEHVSPSSPGLSTSPSTADANPSNTLFHGSFSIGAYMDSVRNGLPPPNHCTSLSGSFGIGQYVSKVRPRSPIPQDQNALIARDHSHSACSYDSSRTLRAQELIEDKQSIHPSRLQMMQEKRSLSDSLVTNTTSTLCLRSTGLPKRALSPDSGICKRPKFSSSSSENIKNDSEPLSLTDSTTFLKKYPTPALIVSNDYVDEFLSDLSDHIYKSVLENLCPDNMRGSFCRTLDVCFKQGCFFACPNFATLRYCRYGEAVPFAHFGYTHTLKDCQFNDKIDCRKNHPDGQPCRVKVLHFHIRAACITLRGGTYCQKEPCEWGHDYKDIRRKVMSAKKLILSELET